MKIFSAAAVILFLAVGVMAQMTNGLSNAEIKGRNLAKQLLEQSPTTDSVQTGMLKILNRKAKSTEIPVLFQTFLTTSNWITFYDSISFSNLVFLSVAHQTDAPNRYDLATNSEKSKPTTELMIPFANSDFWLADLGLEFFHWPTQKILKKENRRTRACSVLESTNPDPSTNSYSRVLTWIDNETLGIVFAEAYDANGKKLKEFEPKSFKKVNGQWELKDMEIRNVQTGSRTRIEFIDLTNLPENAPDLPRK